MWERGGRGESRVFEMEAKRAGEGEGEVDDGKRGGRSEGENGMSVLEESEMRGSEGGYRGKREISVRSVRLILFLLDCIPVDVIKEDEDEDEAEGRTERFSVPCPEGKTGRGRREEDEESWPLKERPGKERGAKDSD